MQPAQHQCYTSCLPQAERHGNSVGNTHDTRVGRVASPFQEILSGSWLAEYTTVGSEGYCLRLAMARTREVRRNTSPVNMHTDCF